MTSWSGQSPRVAAITLFQEDLPAAISFYESVFELPVYFADSNSAVFKFEDVLINLLDVSQAPELLGSTPVADPIGGVRSQLTMEVDDVDAACMVLRSRGVTLSSGPLDRPWGIRTAAFCDPGGHVWEIAQDLP